MSRLRATAALVVVFVGMVGCAVTPADRAFVQATRTFFDAHKGRIKHDIETDPAFKSDQARKNTLGELDDFEATLKSNEDRTKEEAK